jgi:hypothetical protein
MSGSQLDHIVWGQYWTSVDDPTYRYWRSLKSADPPQYLGPPISDAIQIAAGVVQRAFASGAVIEYSADNGPHLANDPL